MSSSGNNLQIKKSKKPIPLTKIPLLGDTAGTVIGTTLGIAGVKEPESAGHAWCRGVAICILLGIIVWGIYSEHQETLRIDDLNDVVKKDTIMYNSIMELDECARAKYLKSLKKTFEKETPTLFNKYYKAVQVALVAGVCSEYIINGNASKPIAIVGKTIVYTLLMVILGNK